MLGGVAGAAEAVPSATVGDAAEIVPPERDGCVGREAGAVTGAGAGDRVEASAGGAAVAAR